MTNQPTNTTRKSLFFTLCFAFASLLFACDKPQADKTAKSAAQATATAAAASSVPAADGMPNITTEDMGNLARAMHGAANQQPDDAPKDKYGQPYIIGNLGGVPVTCRLRWSALSNTTTPPPGIRKNCAPTTHRRAAINPSLPLSVFISLTVMRNC